MVCSDIVRSSFTPLNSESRTVPFIVHVTNAISWNTVVRADVGVSCSCISVQDDKVFNLVEYPSRPARYTVVLLDRALLAVR